MAATNFTPIQLYYSTTASAAPSAGNLLSGELAVNIADGKLFYKDSGGVVQTLATKGTGTIGGSTTQVQYNSGGSLAGSSNLTYDGTALTMGANPTLSAGTANGVAYLNASKVLTSGSNLTFDGTTLTLDANQTFNNSRVLQWKNTSGVTRPVLQIFSDNNLYLDSEDGAQVYRTAGTEQMRLTSDGLGIGGVPEAGIKLKLYGALKVQSAQPVYLMNSDNTNNVQIANAGATGVANGQMAFTLGAVGEGMRLTSTGLGIGTTSPATKLHISGTGTQTVRISTFTSGNPVLSMNAEGSNGGAITYDRATSSLVFANGGIDRATLDLFGNLGIGTSSPGARLDVRGASLDIGLRYIETTTGNLNRIQLGAVAGAGYIDVTAGTGLPSLQLRVASATQATLDSSGNLGLGVTPSAWAVRALELSGSPSLSSVTGTDLTYNAYYDGAWKYIATARALLYSQVASSGEHRWFNAASGTAGNAISFTQAMTLDASGNLGVAAIPSAWSNGFKALQVNGPYIAANGFLNMIIGTNTNAGVDGGGSGGTYAVDGFATKYQQNVGAGQHRWLVAPSGTAGNAITFTQAMTLDASGNLGVGTTSPAWRVHAVSATDGRIQVEGSSGYGMVFIQGSSGNSAQLQLNSNGGTGRRYSIVSSPTGSFLVSDETATTTRVTLDASGNLGLSVTPGAWVSNAKALQISSFLSAWQGSNGSVNLGFGVYEGGINTYQYSTTGDAPTMYQQLTGSHAWFSAPSGTAGNTIAFTRVMNLDASGNLALGQSSAAYRLDVLSGADVAIRARSSNSSEVLRVESAGTSSAQIRFINTSANNTYINADGGALAIYTSATEQMRLDASGNLGLGVTPSAWSIIKAIEIGSFRNAFYSDNGSTLVGFSSGSYYNAGWKYAITGAIIGRYEISGSSHAWYTAPNGTAGNAITFTQAMTLDGAGNLLLGTTGGLNVSARARFYAPSNQVAAEFYGAGANNRSLVYLSNDNNLVAIAGFNDTFVTYRNQGASLAETSRITGAGNIVYFQPAESAQNTSVTLTAANLQAQIITSNAAVTLTLPTGTSLEGYTTGMATDTAFEVTFIATTANAITIAANGNTTVGNLTVSGNTSGTFRFRKTATNTFTVYRIS